MSKLELAVKIVYLFQLVETRGQVDVPRFIRHPTHFGPLPNHSTVILIIGVFENGFFTLIRLSIAAGVILGTPLTY